MRSTTRFAAGVVWCTTAAALAVAEEPGVVVIQGGGGAVQVQVQVVPAVPVEPAADPEPEPQKLDQLPPAPQLLEKVMRDFLEGVPGKETLDDVMRRAAARKRVAAQAAEVAQRRQFMRQQTQQFEQMLQPLLNVELALVRRACGSLPPQARQEVFAAARQAVHDVAERVARVQLEGAGDAEPLDVRRAIHERIAAAVEPRAAGAEFAAYEAESRQRQERRAEAARIRIVAKVDAQLGLTADQRRAVLDDLRSKWQATWIRELEDHDGMLINDFPPAPDFADAGIVPHLDPLQRRQWRQWTEAAGWNAVPRGGIDWAELNALQQFQVKPDAWWRP